MVDNAGISSAQGHSEVKALAPAAGMSAPNQAEFETATSPKETPRQRTEDSSHGICLVALPATNTHPARRLANSTDKIRHPKKRTRSSFDAICKEPATSSTMQASAAQLTIETTETCASTKAKNAAMIEMPGEGCYAFGCSNFKTWRLARRENDQSKASWQDEG